MVHPSSGSGFGWYKLAAVAFFVAFVITVAAILSDVAVIEGVALNPKNVVVLCLIGGFALFRRVARGG